jgi:homoserine kinase
VVDPGHLCDQIRDTPGAARDMTLTRRRLVRVPASSANLGPGFDVLAAALALHLELDVRETGTFAVRTELDVPRDRSNLVVRAFERLHPADGFEFSISSNIPLSGGLGSSSAAIVAGLTAADHLFELDADVLALATELEGHSDNAAAALSGGFVVWNGTTVHRFEPPMGLEAVLVIPHEAARTETARAALPQKIPIEDAVFNVSHAAMLVLGLATADWDLISAGLHDKLHQPHRAHLYPRSAELLDRAQARGALGATISGAGPSVLVWCRYDQTGPVIEALKRETDGWAAVIRVPFEPHGADVRAL